MKKIRSFVIAAVIAIAALVCVPTVLMQDSIKTVEAATVKLSKTSITLNAGGTATLKVYGTTKKVTWSSSDKNVVTVSSSGKVTAKAMGQAKIYAKVNGKTYTCKVVVNNSKSISDIGDTLTLSVNGTTKKVTWTTSNKKVATVFGGKVTAKGMGKATIYAKVNGTTFAKCTVTVNDKQSISDVGDKTTLKVNTTKKITWSSSNKNVATVTSAGKVTAKGMGRATIYAKVDGTTYAKCVITVNDNKVLSDVGNYITLSVKGTSKTVTWTTSNKNVATVSSSGKVTAKGMGQATIYAKVNGYTFAKCVVRVNDQRTLSDIGNYTTLSVKGTSKTVTWTTSNKNVATVSGGKVTAKGMGKATIYAKVNGTTFASCTVTVNDKYEFNKSGEYKVFEIKNSSVTPTWSSSNTSVATVDASTGRVRTVGFGQTVITASVNGNTYAKCLVRVNRTAEVKAGYSETLKLDGFSGAVTWKSANENIATVDAYTGKVIGRMAGTTTIKAIVDGSVYAKCTVTVTSNPKYELRYYMMKNGSYDSEANAYSIGSTSEYNAEAVQRVAGIIGEFPAETIPVESIITYSVSDSSITFVSDITMTMKLSDFEGYTTIDPTADPTVTMTAKITMVYDLEKDVVNPMKFELSGISEEGIPYLKKSDTEYYKLYNMYVGAAYSNTSYKLVTPIVADENEVIESMYNLGFSMSTVSGEKLNSIVVTGLEKAAGVTVTEADFLQAAEYHGNVAFYEWDMLLETLPLNITLDELGFDSYTR